MWIEIYNYVTTKRKFVARFNSRFFMFKPFIKSLFSMLKAHELYSNERINFLLLSKSPYVAIKI